MKKLLILGLVLLMVVVFASMFAIAQEGKGAVKVVLYERDGDEDQDDPGNGEAAGWAIINTTADGKLQVEVHMYNAPEDTYDLYVCTWSPYVPNLYAELLTTNKNGIGNAHVELDIPEGMTKVKVVVKNCGGAVICGYTNGLSEVPLKK